MNGQKDIKKSSYIHKASKVLKAGCRKMSKPQMIYALHNFMDGKLRA